MKPIIPCFVIVVLAFCPFTAGADVTDNIRVGVSVYPELSPVAIEILDKISKGASPDEQERLARQWDAAFKEVNDAKVRAERERGAAEEKRTPFMRAAVLAACTGLRQRKVDTRFWPSDDGTSLTFVARAYGAYQDRSVEVECRAVPDDPLNGKWTVSYPKFQVAQAGSSERPGYRFVEQTTSTCTVTKDELISYLSKEPGVSAPWARD
jgi:hypothetical protein